MSTVSNELKTSRIMNDDPNYMLLLAQLWRLLHKQQKTVLGFLGFFCFVWFCYLKRMRRKSKIIELRKWNCVIDWLDCTSELAYIQVYNRLLEVQAK